MLTSPSSVWTCKSARPEIEYVFDQSSARDAAADNAKAAEIARMLAKVRQVVRIMMRLQLEKCVQRRIRRSSSKCSVNSRKRSVADQRRKIEAGYAVLRLEQVVGGCLAKINAYNDEARGEGAFAALAKIGLNANGCVRIV